MALVARKTCSGATSNAFQPRLPLGLPPFALRAAWGLCSPTYLKPKARPGRTPPPGGSRPQLPGLLGGRRPAGSASPGRAAAARAAWTLLCLELGCLATWLRALLIHITRSRAHGLHPLITTPSPRREQRRADETRLATTTAARRRRDGNYHSFFKTTYYSPRTRSLRPHQKPRQQI